ncbi:MAG: hypothetical protein IJM15_06265, partial [Erysipelotrichaceae bacterium]|nr:hypothetical protein [Erysipelotrichaceae bacterium]
MGILKAIGLIILILVLLIALLFTVIVLFLNFSPVVGKNRKKEEMDRLCQNLPHYHDGAFHNSQKLTVMTGEKPYSSDCKKPSTMIRAYKPDFK